MTQDNTPTQETTTPTEYDTPVIVLGVSDKPSIYHPGHIRKHTPVIILAAPHIFTGPLLLITGVKASAPGYHTHTTTASV